MANGVVTVDIGDVSAIVAAQQLAYGTSDLTGLFRSIAATLERNIQARFDTKTDPDGVPWPAWAPSTAKQRARKGYSAPGNLMQLHNPGLRNSVSSSASSVGATLTVGADYGKYHEQIDGPGKGHIPRRAFLLSATGGLGQQDSDDIATAVQAYFNMLMQQP